MDRKNYIQATIEKFGIEHPEVELRRTIILDQDIFSVLYIVRPICYGENAGGLFNDIL